MDKKYFDIIFVVLVYKNVDVLKEFFRTLNLSFTYRVVVVNSFYDKVTENDCRLISSSYGADYISIPNLGYSAGNNRGCEYAVNNYKYKYLVVANSDVIINDFSFLGEINLKNAVIAPDTKMINGKRQNPNIPFKSKIYLKSLERYYKTKKSFYLTIGLIFNRLYREFVILVTKLFNIKLSSIKFFK